jgi:UDP-3-O-[3-hydroxymyristoyl] glucosamine N-acyltransferase
LAADRPHVIRPPDPTVHLIHRSADPRIGLLPDGAYSTTMPSPRPPGPEIEMPAIYGRHSIISEDAQIGENTRIGNFVFIRDNTVIGKACSVGSYVDIEGDVRIGDFVSLQSGCYLTRGVVIEDRSVLRS